jgi:hypothetical protein
MGLALDHASRNKTNSAWRNKPLRVHSADLISAEGFLVCDLRFFSVARIAAT